MKNILKTLTLLVLVACGEQAPSTEEPFFPEIYPEWIGCLPLQYMPFNKDTYSYTFSCTDPLIDGNGNSSIICQNTNPTFYPNEGFDPSTFETFFDLRVGENKMKVTQLILNAEDNLYPDFPTNPGSQYAVIKFETLDPSINFDGVCLDYYPIQ